MKILYFSTKKKQNFTIGERKKKGNYCKVGKPWYEVADHLDREDVMALLKVVLNNCIFFSGKVLPTITWCCNGFSMFAISG